MSKVKWVIKELEYMPDEEHICVTLWTKEGVEELLDTKLNDDEWDKCIEIWDNNDNQSDQWYWITTYAKEQLEETAQ
jgi:hypothetical protein